MGRHNGEGVPQGARRRQSQKVSIYAPAARPSRATTAFLFDLDGTLLDSIGGVVDALNGVLKTLGRRRITPTEAVAFSGDGAEALVARAVAATGIAAADGALPDLVRRYERLRHARGDQSATLFPGVEETLTRLADAGSPMALCTNRPFRQAAAAAARFRLDRYLSEIVAADSVGARKPDPALVQEALRRLDVPPARAVFVGDAAEDVEAGRAAGLRVILVSYGYAKGKADAKGAAAVIDDLRDLEGALTPKPKAPRKPLGPDWSKLAQKGRAAASAARAEMKAATRRAVRSAFRIG